MFDNRCIPQPKCVCGLLLPEVRCMSSLIPVTASRPDMSPQGFFRRYPPSNCETFLMSARAGVATAVLSSTLGGLAAVATRFVAGDIDPVTIAAFRFGGGFLCLLPIALALRSRWPSRGDGIG